MVRLHIVGPIRTTFFGGLAVDWTDERISELTRMWREGLSASQVARRLGAVSRSAVIGKVHRLGISARETPTGPRPLGGRPPNLARRRPTNEAGARPAAPRAPRPTRAAPFEVAPTANIQTLSAHGCRWPIGDPDDASFGFCGRLRAGRGSYCAGHSSMASRRSDGGFKASEIDRLVSRFGEGEPRLSGASVS